MNTINLILWGMFSIDFVIFGAGMVGVSGDAWLVVANEAEEDPGNEKENFKLGLCIRAGVFTGGGN